MTTPYYEFTTPVVAGTTVRSDKYNTDHQAIQIAFEAVQADTAVSLKVPTGWTGALELPAIPVSAGLVQIDAVGNWSYYSLAEFDAAVTQAEGYRDEALTFRNEAEAFALNASDSATAAAGYAATVGVPVIVAGGGSFTIPENQPAIEIVCLGSATIAFPATPFPDAKYIVKSTDKNGVITGVLGAGHQITDSNGVLHDSFTIEGLYQLDAHWLGAGVYRGF